jgi:hypothetical protein
MSQIQIVNSTTLALPYQVFACDVYGNQCAILATIGSYQPPILTLTLPPQFNYAPSIGVKIIDFNECEYFKILSCLVYPENKQFQNGENFFFMDDISYDFQS